MTSENVKYRNQTKFTEFIGRKRVHIIFYILMISNITPLYTQRKYTKFAFV